MVMIISSPEDFSTNDIIDWLRHYKINFLRISMDDIIKYENAIISITEFNIEFSINDIKYKLSDFSAFWYRRSHFNVFVDKVIGNDKITKQINKHLLGEAMELHKLLVKHIRTKSINNYNDIYINKLDVLKVASDLGLKIPDTLVTNNINDVSNFLQKHKNVITKNFSQGVFIFENKKIFSSITRMVTPDVFKMLPNNFFYCLFQEGIDKLFELRVFYLNGKFYASAIFSQNDKKTSVDFRNYNFLKPNRTPPFNLPNEIAIKLKKLMDEFRLNSGSIDLLVSTSNEFVFLEVNPIGQFGQVSIPCNYYLEKKIAKQLINISADEIN